MNPRVVCFDVGGVLARIVKTWEDALTLSGVSSSSEHRTLPFWAFPGLDPYQAGDITFDEYLTQLAEYLDLAMLEQARQVHDAILVQEFPGVFELGNDLRADGILTACMSNTNAPHLEIMVASGRFPAIAALSLRVTSHEVGINKPNEGLYLVFEQRSGFKGEDILFFDDSPANIDAAINLGWRGHVIDPTADTAEQMRCVLKGYGWRENPA